MQLEYERVPPSEKMHAEVTYSEYNIYMPK